jgi:hypothetical protein
MLKRGGIVDHATTDADEELLIFVEHLIDFINVWTVYNDLLTRKYVPTPDTLEWARTSIGTTIMFALHSYLYALIEDSTDGLNAFRIWRRRFPEEEQAIAAIEAQIAPFKNELRVFRNRLGFHGSRSRSHESKGLDLFAITTGLVTWDAIKNFKALAVALLAYEMALQKTDEDEARKYRGWIDSIAERARQQFRNTVVVSTSLQSSP